MTLQVETLQAAPPPLPASLKETRVPPRPDDAGGTSSEATPRTSSTAVRRARKLLMGVAAAAIVAGAISFGWHYWTVGRFEISTDDAYVQADNTTIAPKVSGYISDVSVADNETVKKGKVVARIDDRDYSVALQQAKANVAQARAAIAGKQAALDMQQSAIDAARAALAVDQASLTFAGQENRRYSDLAATGSGSAQNAQQAASRLAIATASVQRDQATVVSSLKQVDALKADLAQAHATLDATLAAQRQAELNLSYTTISAPVDGVVGNRTLRVGQYVQAGTQLMSIVPIGSTYIVANYKETQLTHVLPGQSVDIEVDTYPGAVIHGHVDSIAPASGQQFALLPPDNATGNFTKVVQRIPVKIALDPHEPLSTQLRPGMSVTPTIDTKAASTRVAERGIN
ncbi:HlyD family secretion protein [Bradyrhizobium sp. LHD-71]|uniref:HlyD family secretion protein n=1 Tax=Bradyrhizobium sp. LHD-71 TaxID=3072141 RepID=UPI0035BE9B8A